MPASATADAIVVCPTCGAKNRIGALGVAQAAVCGRCKTALPTASAGPISVTDANFAELVEGSSVPVLVDFWAGWCGPCRMLAPAIGQLAGEFAGRVRVAKLNTDENQRTAARYRIDSLPTLVVFKNGREVDRLVGLMPKQEIARRLEALS